MYANAYIIAIFSLDISETGSLTERADGRTMYYVGLMYYIFLLLAYIKMKKKKKRI